LCNAQARVRFSGTDGAKLALEKAKESVDGIIKVDDVEVCCSVLEGKCLILCYLMWLYAEILFVKPLMKNQCINNFSCNNLLAVILKASFRGLV